MKGPICVVSAKGELFKTRFPPKKLNQVAIFHTIWMTWADGKIRQMKCNNSRRAISTVTGRSLLLQMLLLVSRKVHEVHQSQRVHHDGSLRKELLLVSQRGFQLAPQKHCQVWNETNLISKIKFCLLVGLHLLKPQARYPWAETTVYSDRLSINYPPISDAFDNREYFSALYKWFNFDIIEK